MTMRVALLCFAAPLGQCQNGGAARLQFEVESIKPITVVPGQPVPVSEIGVFVTPTSLSIKRQTLRTIIGRAFGIPTLQVVGPAALRNTFQIAAKIPTGAGRGQVPEMLQTLLQERFGLESHEETRTVKGFEVTIEDRVLLKRQLLLGDPGQLPQDLVRPVRLIIELSSLTEVLTDLLATPVVASALPDTDERYLFWIETSDGASSIARSLKQYGLRLTSGKIDAKYRIVDKINDMPTPN